MVRTFTFFIMTFNVRYGSELFQITSPLEELLYNGGTVLNISLNLSLDEFVFNLHVFVNLITPKVFMQNKKCICLLNLQGSLKILGLVFLMSFDLQYILKLARMSGNKLLTFYLTNITDLFDLEPSSKDSASISIKSHECLWTAFLEGSFPCCNCA